MNVRVKEGFVACGGGGKRGDSVGSDCLKVASNQRSEMCALPEDDVARPRAERISDSENYSRMES